MYVISIPVYISQLTNVSSSSLESYSNSHAPVLHNRIKFDENNCSHSMSCSSLSTSISSPRWVEMSDCCLSKSLLQTFPFSTDFTTLDVHHLSFQQHTLHFPLALAYKILSHGSLSCKDHATYRVSNFPPTLFFRLKSFFLSTNSPIEKELGSECFRL